MNRLLNNWLSLIFIISLVAISIALTAEIFFDLIPCKMCLKQRHTYYAIIFIVILFYFFNHLKNIWIFILNEIAILYGIFYAFWHVGVERKFLPGLKSCSGTLEKTSSIQNLKQQINNQAIVNCSDITWSIFGLSAASLNSLVLLFILLFNSIYIKKYYDTQKENKKK